MASYTPNYSLKKPADADTYDIADANGNMDLIDTALHSQNEAIGNLSSLSTTAKNDLVSAINEVYVKEYNIIYNANTDRNTESNRITAMEYLKTNYFNYGYTKAAVRYASGYYHGYVFVGEYTGSDSLIIEIPHNLTSGEQMIAWRRLSSGEYIKQFVSSNYSANIDTTTFTLASGYTANINSVSKNNKIVTIEGEINFASTTSKSFTSIITIPSGYRPTSNFVVSAIDPINDELLAGTLLSSTGNLSFYRSSSTPTTQIRFSATYITN